jgi:signal transduction histidine kinase
VLVRFHDRAAVRWQLPAVLVLFVLLATLGTLQYRWLGEVSEAERTRMRDSLQTRANDLAADFDRELTRTYLAFHLGTEAFDRDPATAIADAFASAQASGATRLIRALYLVDAGLAQPPVLRRFDPSTRTLSPAEWPPPLERWRQRVESAAPPAVRPAFPILLSDAVDAAAPALVVPVPKIRRMDRGRIAVLPDASGAARAILIWLDASAIDSQLLRPLVAKYFGPPDSSEYLVTIVGRDDPARMVFSSAPASDAAAADVTTGLFDLRMDEINRIAAGLGIRVPAPAQPPGSGGAAPGEAVPHVASDKMAIAIVRRANAPDGSGVVITGGNKQGAWQLRAGHRRGSLEAIVAQSRRRNLAIGLGVLGLLGASFILVMAAAHRQQRLARQQMEFVAAVSHELRTPLAVICSAGENLADGVVADTRHVKRYGSLIESEGRRLGDMVERVLQFAGIDSGAPPRARTDVDISRAIADAVQGASIEARERAVTIAVRSTAALPPTMGDADALRSAVQNIIGNAVKYSPDGGIVEVTTDLAAGDIVTIEVADRGIGIDAADLPHVFKPFFRGRRAVEAQVRGTGVGLSVVRHVVQSHGGDVRVESTPGQGTTVTITLPVQSSADPSGGRVVRLRPGAAS